MVSVQSRRIPLLSLTAAVVAGALIGAGGGAGIYAAFSSGNKTIVRQVPVADSQPASSTSGLSVNSIYKLAYRGVVEVKVKSQSSDPFGGTRRQSAEGSGFVYDTNGHVITNQHVVDGATSVQVTFWNGKTYNARVVGTDASTDLAVLDVNAPSSDLYPLTLGDSSKVQVGDNVVAIGAPFGLAETVTAGIVSALHRQMTSPNNFTIDDSIQTDAAINHGNSGGPLLNMQGRVIGVTSQIESDSGGNDGVGFAVPSNTVRKIAAKLVATGKVEHAYLGVSLAAPENGAGAGITGTCSDAPAANAGLQAGDVVTAFAGKKISSVDALRFAVDAKKPGDHISVTFLRGGRSKTATVTLGTRPASTC